MWRSSRKASKKVRLRLLEPSQGFPFNASVKIMARGKVYTESSAYATGDPFVPETRLTKEDFDAKFRTWTYGSLMSTKADKAIETLWNLENLQSIPELTKLLA